MDIQGISSGIIKDNQHKSDDMKKATKEFESFFLNYLLKTMRESLPKNGLMSGGKGGEIYTSMLDEALSGNMAERGGIGIGDLMLKQLEPKKIQDTNKSSLLREGD